MRLNGGKLEMAKLRGGKQDDITVVVCRVDEETVQSQPPLKEPALVEEPMAKASA